MSRRVRRTNRPDYRLAQRRQRRAIKLYRRGLTPPQIAKRLGCAPTTIWRYLRATPKLQTAKAIPHIWSHRRPVYWALHTRDGASEIVCSRKFCTVCGVWRHLCDFQPESRRHGAPYPRCRTCSRVSRNYYFAHEGPEQATNRRERHRIYYEGVRRRNGVPVSTHNRRTAIDRREAIYFPIEPLREALERFEEEWNRAHPPGVSRDRNRKARNGYTEGAWTVLAARADVPERTIYRIRHTSQSVQIDVLDKLAVAMGTTSSLIYGDRW